MLKAEDNLIKDNGQKMNEVERLEARIDTVMSQADATGKIADETKDLPAKVAQMEAKDDNLSRKLDEVTELADRMKT